MGTIEEKLKELFSISLRIGGVTFSHDPLSKQIHIYRFVVGVDDPQYDVGIFAIYADWMPENDEKSLNGAIQKAKQLINS